MLTTVLQDVRKTRNIVTSMTTALATRIHNRLSAILRELPDANDIWARKYDELKPSSEEFDYFILEDSVMKCFLDGTYEPATVERLRELITTFGDIEDLLNDLVRFEGDCLQALRVEYDDLRIQKKQLTNALARKKYRS